MRFAPADNRQLGLFGPTGRFQNILEDQRSHDGGVTLDDEPRRLRAELAPRDLFVRDGAGIRAVARGRVRDLAEVAD